MWAGEADPRSKIAARPQRLFSVWLVVFLLVAFIMFVSGCGQEAGSTKASGSSGSAATPSSSSATSAARTSVPGSAPASATVSTTHAAATSSIPPAAAQTSGSSEAHLSAGSQPVLSVVDGDTINVVFEGVEEAVRLIGFDTPEEGEPFAAEATGCLRRLVGGTQVRLEFDVQERDQYGRLLAYVWVGSTMANAELLRQGLATLYTVPPNVKYADLFTSAQNEARAAGRGIWEAPAGCPLEISNLHPDAAGNDNFNLNDEWIEFRVLIPGTLAGYSLEDEAGHTYFFPDRVFQTGEVFKVHTGPGADTQADLYWGHSESAIWNNGGDTIKLLDAQGHVVISRSY